MRSKGIIRNIDELGRLVVPKEMRTTLDINCNDPVEISMEGNSIILKKHIPFCVFCGNSNDLSVFKDKKICSECLAELAK